MDDLVTRLRQLEQRITAGANEACGQAADRITAQAAEIERLTAENEWLIRASKAYRGGAKP